MKFLQSLLKKVYQNKMALFHTLSANVNVEFFDSDTLETCNGHVSGNEGDNIYIISHTGEILIKKDIDVNVNE